MGFSSWPVGHEESIRPCVSMANSKFFKVEDKIHGNLNISPLGPLRFAEIPPILFIFFKKRRYSFVLMLMACFPNALISLADSSISRK